MKESSMDADVLQAKQVLSARLLGTALRTNVASMVRTFRVADAVASAGA
jgi:hypothetical protein